jgi:hypothetical protein
LDDLIGACIVKPHFGAPQEIGGLVNSSIATRIDASVGDRFPLLNISEMRRTTSIINRLGLG